MERKTQKDNLKLGTIKDETGAAEEKVKVVMATGRSPLCLLPGLVEEGEMKQWGEGAHSALLSSRKPEARHQGVTHTCSLCTEAEVGGT